MPLFTGDANENPILFMEEFALYSQLLNWSDDQCLLTFPLSLKGQARLWFSALPAGSYKTMEELTQLFRDRFVSSSANFLLRQKLTQRKQLPSESVDSFITDIRLRCLRLGITKDEEQLHYFVSGLRPELQSHVILNKPDTLAKAEELAKLKDLVSSPPSFSLADIQTLQKQFINVLDTLKRPSQPPKQSVSAYDQNSSSSSQFVESEIREIIRQELIDLQSQTQTNYRQHQNQSRNSNSNNSSRPRNNYSRECQQFQHNSRPPGNYQQFVSPPTPQYCQNPTSPQPYLAPPPPQNFCNPPSQHYYSSPPTPPNQGN